MEKRKPWDSNNQRIQRFRHEVDGMISKFLNDSSFTSNFWNQEDSTIIPKCNVKEEKNHYYIEVELPGVDPKEINIELTMDTISIKGERKRETAIQDEEHKFHVIERRFGSFYRSFTLPTNIDIDSIQAENIHGVLRITLPKIKEPPARRIDIK